MSETRLPYVAALDGLRGVAVAAVLCFHAGFGWAIGGYLGVSTFFTLSGFLIATLLIDEHDRSGGIGLRGFWSRRFRRLMPASLLTLALAVCYGATVADASQLRDLRGDVMAALAYVANWRFLLDGESYADLFTLPSPVLQFWSLAIEEQFYLFFPLLVVGVLRLAGASRRVLGATFATGIAASLSLALFSGWSDDRIYFGTDTRASELFVGALLAIAVRTAALARPARVTRHLVATAGTVALVAVLYTMHDTSQSNDLLYDGGFTIFAALSALVVLAAIQPGGPVPAVLSLRPLVLLGRISYGVYLYHWLVFLWLTPDRTGLHTWPLFGLRLAVTLAAASASYVLLEQPIRLRRALTDRQVLVAGPVAAAAVVVALVLVTLSPPRPPIDFAAAEAALAATPITPPGDAAAATPAGGTLPVPPAPRVAVFGDSTALMTAVGLTDWMEQSGDAVPAGGNSWLGCGVGRGGERRTVPGDETEVPENCDQWAVTWARAIAAGAPDLAVVQVGPWEVADRRLEGDDQWRAPGDRAYDEYLLDEMLAATDVLSAEGAEVVWLTSPPVGPGESGDEQTRRGEASDPERMERLNELIARVAEERPGTAHVVDLAGYVAGTGDDVRLRPDGVHFSDSTSAEVATSWLGPRLVALHRAEWIDEWSRSHEVPVPEPLRVLVVGDSTAMLVGFGLNELGHATGEVEISSLAEIGCGLGRGGRRDYQGVQNDVPLECEQLWDRWADAVTTGRPDVVVMLTGPFDVSDRMLDGDDRWRAPGDPVYDRYLRSEMREAADILTSEGALVVWLSSPLIDVGRADVSPPSDPYPASDPARMHRLNELITELAAENDDIVIADYAGRLRTYPGGELDAAMRPDGVHLANDRTIEIAEWLVPEIRRRYADRVVADWKAAAGTSAEEH